MGRGDYNHHIEQRTRGDPGHLDGPEALRESGHILIQAVTESKLTGAEREPVEAGTVIRMPGRDGETEDLQLPPGTMHITAIGEQPFRIGDVHAVIRFKQLAAREAVAVDLYGYADPSQPVAIAEQDGGAVLELPRRTYYTVLRGDDRAATE